MEPIEKFIVFNLGWMKNYRGFINDEIHSTAKFIVQNNYGYEAFNFLPFEGYMYGFVQPSGKKSFHERTIRIERLGSSGRNSDFVDEVLIAWVARKPEGGTYLVGWYKNATVYAHYQDAPIGSGRELTNDAAGYFAKAKEQNCVLLPIEERVVQVPRATSPENWNKGGIGQSCIWFVGNEKPNDLAFRQELWQFIKDYEQQRQLINYNKGNEIVTLPEEIIDSDTLYEGTVFKISVNAYERNLKARRQCIIHYGTSCSVCGFNFREVYGKVGEGFIHVHHLRPLADIGEEYKIDSIVDLRPVCPNCHAIIHKRNPPYSIEEVKEFLRRNS